MSRQNVEADGKVHVGGVHQDHVVNPVIGNDAKNLIDQIAMGIKDAHAFAVLDVLPDEIKQQRRLAGAGGADDVRVAHPLVGDEIDRNGFAIVFVVTNDKVSRFAHDA